MWSWLPVSCGYIVIRMWRIDLYLLHCIVKCGDGSRIVFKSCRISPQPGCLVLPTKHKTSNILDHTKSEPHNECLRFVAILSASLWTSSENITACLDYYTTYSNTHIHVHAEVIITCRTSANFHTIIAQGRTFFFTPELNGHQKKACLS